jgi:hypothetical protein
VSLLIVPIVTGVRVAALVRTNMPQSVHDYHALDRVLPLIGGSPLALLTEDALATHWGAYYLRRGRFLLGTRNGYLGMPQVQQALSRAQPVSPHDVRLVVTDADASLRAIDTSPWTLAWNAGAFALWDTGDRGWATVASVRDPVIVRASPRSLFYIHRGVTTLEVLASDPGTLTLTGQLMGVPPSETPCWRLQVHGVGDRADERWDLHARTGPVTFTVHVPAGASEITMQGHAVDPAIHADVLIYQPTTRFQRAETGAVAAPQYQPCGLRSS